MESTEKQEQPSRRGPKPGASTSLGKHRMTVVISHLHNQINLIKEELEALETLGGPSIVCNELLSSVESVPDPLLPVTKGPPQVAWDRWFNGAQNSRTHKRWI